MEIADIGIKVGCGKVREEEYLYLNCQNCQSLTGKWVWTYHCKLLPILGKEGTLIMKE